MNSDFNQYLNPILLSIVGFFILRLIKTFDDLNKAVFEIKTQMTIMKSECDRVKEEIAVLKRDQLSIWRNIDLLKGEKNGRYNGKDSDSTCNEAII